MEMQRLRVGGGWQENGNWAALLHCGLLPNRMATPPQNPVLSGDQPPQGQLENRGPGTSRPERHCILDPQP